MKEWYLMASNTNQNSSGGYGDDIFSEVLETESAADAVLYNSDLSVGREIRCIIQGSSADSLLPSMERSGLFKQGTVKAGMYLFFDNSYWLITGYPGSNGIYEKAVMSLCQHKLRWQNGDGTVTERWCHGTSYVQYETGEHANDNLILSANTYSLLLPNDNESLTLGGRRVFIDKKEKSPQKVYKITRSDDILFNYGEDHGGIIKFIASKTEFNPLTDNPELGICDYRASILSPSTGLPPDLTVLPSIDGSPSLKVGRTAAYTAHFTDKDHNPLTGITAEWNVICDYKVYQHIEDNSILLEINDENAIGSTLILQLSNYGYELELNIESLY